MDEYFCPNCGAILNDQYGFDPSRGFWSCTCCGKLLMDDDIYEGDIYEGVAWFCDNCGALLNRQPGFSDIYDSWACTECGYGNIIADSEIYESEEDYQYNKDSRPNAATYYQESEQEYEEEEYEEDDDEYEEECEENEFQETVEHIRQAESEQVYQEEEHTLKNALKKKRVKAFLFNKKKIEIHYSHEELIGNNISFVVSLLTKDAFSNIKTVSEKDIYEGSKYKVGQVEQVRIGGSSIFRKSDLIPYDAEIIVTYHEKREIIIPFSERSLRKTNYVLAIDRLQKLGFTEIHQKPIHDLIVGWAKKDGAVERITINGVSSFKKNSVFVYDAQIIIEYHTFKSK